MRKSWFKIFKASSADLIKCSADNTSDVTVIEIYDEIGNYGVTAKDFLNKLNGVATPKILIKLHSPGGSVLDGLAIYNALRAHTSEVYVSVIGYAASMASIIALAADSPQHLFMSENAYLMFHRPTMAGMNTDELKAYLDEAQTWFKSYVPQVESDIALMRSMEEMFIRMYSSFSNWDEQTAKQKMYATTWLTAQDAVEAGFVDAGNVTEPVKLAANATADLITRFGFYGYNNIPKNIAAKLTGENDGDNLLLKLNNIFMGFKKITVPAVLDSLVSALQAKGFKVSGPTKDETKNANLLADVIKAVKSEFKEDEQKIKPGMKAITAFDAAGKPVKVFVKAETKPTPTQGEVEEAETEETETEETETEETETEEGADPEQSEIQKALAKLQKAQDEQGNMLKKVIARKAGTGGEGDGGESATLSVTDILTGNIKGKKPAGNFGGNKEIDKAAKVIAARLSGR